MMNPNEKSRVLTLVFTDLADSTALKTARGDQAVDALIARHREHVVRLAEGCSGRVIDWAGDGCFLTFETSSAAVMFALQLQQAHAEESDLPGVRIGVHLGEVTERSGPDGLVQVKGLAVDVAARVQGLAKPGQVLMSSSVYNSARQRMGVDTMGQPILWQLHGLYDLKGLDHPLEIGEAGLEGLSPLEAPEAGEKARPVGSASSGARRQDFVLSWAPTRQSMLPVLLAIGLLVLGMAVVYLFMTRLPDAPTPGRESIAGDDAIGAITSLAVLPLDNLMNDPDQDYFVDGMMEAITAELSKISSLKVISRTTAMHYKATELSMPEIAAELGVQGLIEGSVLRQGNEVRITVQLIDGPADTHLWAKSYDGTLEDIFKLHSDVALAIAEEIRAVVSPEEQSRIASAPKVDPEAYELYLRGLETYFDGSVSGSMRAIRYFEDALEIEPDFALAWSAKSMAHFSILVWVPSAYIVQSRLAKDAADKAIALAPDEAGAYVPKFQLEFFSLDWYAAKATADRAYDLNPNLAENNLALGELEAARGNFVEAEKYLERAYALDWRSTFIAPHAGSWLVAVGRQARGVQILERFAADNPDFPLAHAYIGMALVYAERYDEALEAFDQLDRLVGASLLSKMFRATILAWTGSLEEARSLGREILSGSAPTDMPLSIVAIFYASVGEIDKSFDYFELAMESSDVGFVPVFRTALFTPGWSPRGPGELPDYDRYWELTDRMNYPLFPEGHPGHDRQQAWLARKAAAEQTNAPIDKPIGEPEAEGSND